MSRLTELIAYVKNKDPQIGIELENEFKEHSSRLAFGLNFERHRPEVVELARRVIRNGDKVRKLSPRGEKAKNDPRIWIVKKITEVKKKKIALIEIIENQKTISEEISIDDLVVIAEFRDYLYPGLVSTGKVERGGDKPYHTVINGENYHALKALSYSHRGKVDAIYIDPPYNTGAKDWKYNNDYVEKDDLYRHSKWLAFIERRLLLAKQLLNPINSVLIITIDEKEYLRLGLLLEQIFPEASVQMISSVINPSGAKRDDIFSRTDEYIFFVSIGSAKVSHPRGDGVQKEVRWWYLRRTDVTSKRGTKKGGTSQFYPIYVDQKTSRIIKIGKALSPNEDHLRVPVVKGAIAVFPIREDGLHMNWGLTAPSLQRLINQGLVRTTPGHKNQPYIFTYISESSIKKIEEGKWIITGEREDGSKIVESKEGKVTRATTQWQNTSHDAGLYGTQTLRMFLGDRRFPFPKSLYAVEDALRFFVKEKLDAIVLDFFAGSGTTVHAIMRLNKQDNGNRQCICITNNEVGADEQKKLRDENLRPGDIDWEKWGICNYITKPRIEAAITGVDPEGKIISGDYKFIDEFPIADGFKENAEFFDLTYETSISVSYNLAFSRIAPLLWMRAGSQGKRINSIPKEGYEVVETYGLLVDLDKTTDFCKQIKKSKSVKIAYIVTNDDRRFQLIVKRLPETVEPVRLYESYLKNFEITGGE